MFSDLAVLMFSCVLINNILLIQYLGNCPFLGTSKRMETATGMAMAVVFVLVLAGIITWLVARTSCPRSGWACCFRCINRQCC